MVEINSIIIAAYPQAVTAIFIDLADAVAADTVPKAWLCL